VELVTLDVRPLADLAEAAGFNAADLAFLSGLQESTISRLWTDPDWLDRVSGKSLQALIPVLPGVIDYMRSVSIDRRLGTLTAELERHGIVVDPEAIDTAIACGASEEHIGSALQAAAHIVRGDATLTAQHLTRFWGRDQDQVLAILFDSGPGGLIRNPAPLLDAAAAAADTLRAKAGSSFHAFMGYATVAHHTARSTGATISDEPVSGARQAAFLLRSTTIGLILATDDHDLVEDYATEVARSTVAGRVEDWALPTYTRDARASSDFYLPRSVPLHRTADEVLRELDAFNAAYVAYLVRVYLPRALQRDPRFAGRAGDLAAALLTRRDELTDRTTTQHLDTLVHTLERHP
jgi:hypothetical protein